MLTLVKPTRRRRANKYKTRLIIDVVRACLLGKPAQYVIDPSDPFQVESKEDSVTLTLFGSPVMRITLDKNEPDELILFAKNRCDHFGNPGRSSREMINGLLDELGYLEIIPENVRVWLDRNEEFGEMLYLVNFDSKYLLNENYCQMISFKCDPNHFAINQVESEYDEPED